MADRIPWASILTTAVTAASAAFLSAYLYPRFSGSNNSKKKSDEKQGDEQHIESLKLERIELGSQQCRDLFSIDPDTVFLNHGSYGTVPKYVQHFQQRLTEHVEQNPDNWFRYENLAACEKVLKRIASMVNADGADCVFVSNATTGVNAVCASLVLGGVVGAGDQILTPTLAYNAVKNTMDASKDRAKCEYKQFDIPLPVQSEDEIVQRLVAALDENKRVKLVVIDHITSPSALICPIKKMTAECHKRNVLVMVDGAHAIGQVPIDVKDVDCDFYTSNCHKWLFAPKGSAFLYVKREHQAMIVPPITSHCYKDTFQKRFWMQATRDYAPFVATGAAIDFYERIGPERLVKYNTELARWAGQLIADTFKTDFICPPSLHAFLYVVRVPIKDPEFINPAGESKLTLRLMQDSLEVHKIVSVFFSYRGWLYARISINVYNTREDVLKFVKLLHKFVAANAA